MTNLWKSVCFDILTLYYIQYFTNENNNVFFITQLKA